MPSGQTHDRITLWTLPCLGGLTYLLTRSSELTLIGSSAFLFSGLMFGPDLDINSRQYQRWGILRWLWFPYRSLIHHRSCLSHGFLIGTIIRLLYLLIWAGLVAAIGWALASLLAESLIPWQTIDLNQAKLWWQQYQYQAIALFLGLELGAMSHSLSDWLVSTYQSWQKKVNPKKRKPSRSTRNKR